MILIKTIRYYDSLDSHVDYPVNAPTIGASIIDIDRAHPGFKHDIFNGAFSIYADDELLTLEKATDLRSAELVEIYPAVVGAKTADQEKANVIGAALLASAFFTGGTSLAFAQPYLFQAGVLALTYGYTLGLLPADQEASLGSETLNTSGTANEGAAIPLVFGEYRAKGLRVSLEIDNSRRGEE